MEEGSLMFCIYAAVDLTQTHRQITIQNIATKNRSLLIHLLGSPGGDTGRSMWVFDPWPGMPRDLPILPSEIPIDGGVNYFHLRLSKEVRDPIRGLHHFGLFVLT